MCFVEPNRLSVLCFCSRNIITIGRPAAATESGKLDSSGTNCGKIGVNCERTTKSARGACGAWFTRKISEIGWNQIRRERVSSAADEAAERCARYFMQNLPTHLYIPNHHAILEVIMIIWWSKSNTHFVCGGMQISSRVWSLSLSLMMAWTISHSIQCDVAFKTPCFCLYTSQVRPHNSDREPHNQFHSGMKRECAMRDWHNENTLCEIHHKNTTPTTQLQRNTKWTPTPNQTINCTICQTVKRCFKCNIIYIVHQMDDCFSRADRQHLHMHSDIILLYVHNLVCVYTDSIWHAHVHDAMILIYKSKYSVCVCCLFIRDTTPTLTQHIPLCSYEFDRCTHAQRSTQPDPIGDILYTAASKCTHWRKKYNILIYSNTRYTPHNTHNRLFDYQMSTNV